MCVTIQYIIYLMRNSRDLFYPILQLTILCRITKRIEWKKKWVVKNSFSFIENDSLLTNINVYEMVAPIILTSLNEIARVPLFRAKLAKFINFICCNVCKHSLMIKMLCVSVIYGLDSYNASVSEESCVKKFVFFSRLYSLIVLLSELCIRHIFLHNKFIL